MHIPDGFLSAPVLAATGAASIAACGAAAARARKRLEERQIPLLGVSAAFIFAAQMLNFPVAGGTSGHFCGAAMAAILLGPLNAILVMAVVLVIQALVFFDGGVLALSANVFNMGIVAAGAGWGVHALLHRLLPRKRTVLVGVSAFAAWVSTMCAAAAVSVELGLSGTVPLATVLPAMLSVHALIGIGEAVITAAVLATVGAARPDLIPALRGKGAEAAA